MKALELGIGDRISVYKANMIIPQIGENFTRSRALFIPKECPACGGLTEIRQVNDVQSLYCTNPTCQAKKIKAFTLFVSRDGMNVEGLSEATLEKFLGKGFLREFADIFHLSQHKEEIMEMEGFGEKSYKNLLDNIEKARTTTLPKVIYSLGILNIGLANAKMICKEFGYDVEKLLKATKEELSEIDGVGEVIASAFTDYFAKEENKNNFQKLLQELIIEKEEEVYEEAVLKGKSFVITGSLNHFPNRNALKTFIE
jgi:DNA ligase (NAD+)